MKYLLLLTFLSLNLSGCLEERKPVSQADHIQAQRTERAMAEADRQVGMPAIVNWQEKKNMKWIYELRDQEDLITYTYYIDMNGKKHFLGKSIGYGLPYSTQFSNPQKLASERWHNGGGYGFGMPQPEPNGLFMPEGLSATWVILLDKKNEPHVIYIESEILVSPFKMH